MILQIASNDRQQAVVSYYQHNKVHNINTARTGHVSVVSLVTRELEARGFQIRRSVTAEISRQIFHPSYQRLSWVVVCKSMTCPGQPCACDARIMQRIMKHNQSIVTRTYKCRFLFYRRNTREVALWFALTRLSYRMKCDASATFCCVKFGSHDMVCVSKGSLTRKTCL